MRNEAAVRSALLERISASPGDERQELVEEFWVPPTHERVDVAVIGSVMHAYEIKTARDNLNRLPRQLAAYGRIFDRCTLVVADRHVEKALEMVPSWWGVLLVRGDDGPIFATHRLPARNPAVDPDSLVRLLWRDEAHAALVALGAEPNPRTSRLAMWEELLRITSPDAIRLIVRQALLRRQPTHARIPTRRFAAALTASAGP